MVSFQPLEPISKTESVLSALGRKVGAGSELRISERLMAMTAYAQTQTEYYGPRPAEMQVKQPELPEVVKGVLAQYTG